MPSSATDPPRRGISLLVVLVSLVVVGLVAGIAIPTFFHRPEVTLDNACRLMARDLRAAQNYAAFLGRPVAVVFSGHGYEAIDLEAGPLQRGPHGTELRRSYREEGIFDGIRLEDVAFPDSTLVFSPDGEVLTPGGLVIRFRDDERELRVVEGSGKITIGGGNGVWEDEIRTDWRQPAGDG